MPGYSFRRLKISELDDAYAILTEVAAWLLSKGIRQWAQPLPREIYKQRQQRGENYGLFVDGELATVVSLLEYRPEYWSQLLPETNFKWLATLASSRNYSGQKLGELAMLEAEHFLTQEGLGNIYLDCVYNDGMLPRFYSLLGYKEVARKDLVFDWGTFDSVLMCKRLNTL
ncbi:MAG: GNAT family N-acetyltransferase [Chloroflexota bacterium]